MAGLQNTTTPQVGLDSGECGQHPCPPEKRRACKKRPVQHEFHVDVSGDSRAQWSNETRQLLYVLATCYQVIYSQFGLAIHQNDHQAKCRFVEWAQNEIAVVPDFHKQILFSDEAHFWLNGYVNKQNCRIWSKANPQVYVETPLHPEKLTVWCALWAGGILLQKR
ncbi:putative transposable element [Trichonephila clavipes]|nr:putative transposable element [Trichonephila clavipes]